ncbi:MAG: dihydrodipicolinate synthase family protein [Clostridia bacterium]|nr:dihydrodipicolinate synthase family protein [Clostridia bacterium]
MKNKFLVPILTPFNPDGSVNYDALAKLTKEVLKTGADGIYASGSSAECFLLDEEERRKTLETVIANADGAYVMAHIGNIGTKITRDLALHAKSVGANAVASVPPFYFSYPFEGVKDYYKGIAECGLPTYIYSISARTQSFTIDQYEQLLSIDGVEGMKFTETNYFAMQQILARKDINLYSGCDECFLSAISMGAKGAIGTTFNYMMEKYIAIYDAYSKGDMVAALAIQAKANAVTKAAIDCGGLPAFKYLATVRYGIDCGDSRSPFTPLASDKKKYLEKVFAENF